MLRPSYSELMETLNNQKKVESQITSRYTIVLAAAKRARQIIDGANPLTYAPTDRAVSIAVKELDEGKLIIKADPNRLENTQDRPAALYYQGITSVSKDDLREDFKDHYESNHEDDDDDNYKDDDEYKENQYKDDDDETYTEDEDDYKDENYKDNDYQDDDDDSFKDDDENYE